MVGSYVMIIIFDYLKFVYSCIYYSGACTTCSNLFSPFTVWTQGMDLAAPRSPFTVLIILIYSDLTIYIVNLKQGSNESCSSSGWFECCFSSSQMM